METRVPPTGSLSSKIALIGEAPGREEVEKMSPFVGSSGKLLMDLLAKGGILRSQCYISNVVKERPPGNDISKFISIRGSKVKETEAFIRYKQELKEELEKGDFNIIVAVGAISLWALCNKIGITKWRGSILESTLLPGKKVIPIVHPAAALRQYIFRYFITIDINKIKRESQYPEIILPKRRLRISPSYQEALHYIQMARRQTTIAFDIEVVNQELSCFSIALRADDAMSIPLHNGNIDVDEELEILVQLGQLLEDENVVKVGQNMIFDASFMFRKYGIIIRNIEDTMIAQAILYPDFPKGLDFITSVYTNEPYYKDEGKQWMKIGGDNESFWIYNAKDAAVTLEAWLKLYTDLYDKDMLETYTKQRDLIHPLIFMTMYGMRVNFTKMKQESIEAEKKISDLKLKLNEMAGQELNPNSTKQLKEYFYDKRGYKRYINKKTGNISVDANALRRLSRQGVHEASLILEIRRLSKLKSTYLDVKLGEDGRLRAAYNPVGTESGRLSSSKDIFGEGTNVQNLPPEVKKFIIADDGYILYNIDLSQAENRIVAYVAPEPKMIHAFEEGIDVHSLTASLIFGDPIEKIIEEHENDVKCSIGGGRFTKRFYGKKANHCKLRGCEVLTPDGWVGIEYAYINNLKIAQWSKDGSIQFVLPLDWYVDKYTGEIYVFDGKYIFQEMTPEHRIPRIKRLGSEAGLLLDVTAKSIDMVSTWEWPLCGVKVDGHIHIPPLYLRLLIAFQADGGWNYRSPKFKLKNRIKIDRLKTILNMLSIEYTERYDEDCIVITIRARNIARDILWNMFGASKKWPIDIIHLDRAGLEVFCDEIVRWDGDGSCYWTSIYENAQIVQTMFHLCGYKSIIGYASTSTGTFRVSRIDKPDTRLDTIEKRVRYVENEPILCPTVPSGYFLCREGGRISVTGNSLNYGLGYKTFAFHLEIPETEARYIVEKYHEAYPGVHKYHASIRSQLAKNRTIENLFGRKRLFLDRWGDQLFKSAYSFIPQSTVADKINRHGILYIYDNIEEAILLNQVHDSVVFQLPISIGLDRHIEILRAIKESLEQPLMAHGREFIIPAEIEAGFDLKNMTEIDIDKDGLITLEKVIGEKYEKKGR